MLLLKSSSKMLKYNKYSFRKLFSSVNKIDSLISVEDASKLLRKPNVKFFDIRDPKEYKLLHIPWAVNLNDVFSYLARSDSTGIQDLTDEFEYLFCEAGLNKDDHVIFYEDALNTRFGASCRGWYLLNLLGHKNVSVLHGGWKKWRKSDLPIGSNQRMVFKGNFVPSFDKNYWADKDDVLKVVTGETKNVKLLDVRDTVEWTGESSSPYGVDFSPRKGRLPGAVHCLWRDFLYIKDGITYLKEKDEIVEIMRSIGLKPDDDIIIYCFKGARASNSFLVLERAGFKKLRNYFGSWNEWAKIPSLPIDDRKLV